MTTTRRYKQNKTNPEKKGNKKNTTEENNNKTTDICSFVYWFFKSIFRPLLLPSESTWMPWEIIKYNTHICTWTHILAYLYYEKSGTIAVCVQVLLFFPVLSSFLSTTNFVKLVNILSCFFFFFYFRFHKTTSTSFHPFFLFNERYTVYIHILYIVGLLPKLAKSIFDRFCYRNVGLNFSPYK